MSTLSTISPPQLPSSSIGTELQGRDEPDIEAVPVELVREDEEAQGDRVIQVPEAEITWPKK